MNIKIASSDRQIAACYPVMRELRPDIPEDGFVSRVRVLERSGYQLAFLEAADNIVAVAGFRFIENLANGRFLYVDDLVTASASRSSSFGAKLLAWLKEHAATKDCSQLHLDCGIQRKDAHRFYAREAMMLIGYHFGYNIPGISAQVGGE
ncbi:MAG TPA: GNAT family N-acetyltransferase [Gammaproteobacteria bacterium]|nr:GNAT family N-acetyltransferase [Gammaproteobacteria bacterium]